MAEILRQTTVVRDGFHNAFTDLQFWQGNYWVSYRKGSAHVSMDGEAVVAVSGDRQRFRETAHLKMPGDCRDPKLLPVSKNCMAAYFPSWTEGAGERWTDENGAVRRSLQQYITFTENGYDWETPRPVLEPQKWLWRIRRYEGLYYGLIQNLTGDWSDGNKPHKLDLAVSEDLREWKHLTCIGGERGLNESDIHWQDNGDAWVVARTVKSSERIGSYFACASPPYKEWEVTPLFPVIHAPVFIEVENRLYVAGRSKPGRENDCGFPFKGSSLSVWEVGRAEVTPVLRIPATGDCSYAGLIKDPQDRICMSYYSQHAYHHGVVDPPADTGIGKSAADVYFAELELTQLQE